MKYVIMNAPCGTVAQYMPIGGMSSFYIGRDGIHIQMSGPAPPEDSQVSCGKYKTNCWGLYRALKRGGKDVSFSIF